MAEEEFSLSERALVRASATSSTRRAQLRKCLTSHIKNSTREFAKAHGIAESRLTELVDVGMSVFDSVFTVYIQSLHNLDQEEGHFYRYYTWYARQVVVGYLIENPV
jgi:hypothetical protein